ncbi:conserved hypothetical protein [Ricinus communis]|uniref:Uncharacterized protein n=2 Tax=Ricinus communis TaxID=3988 RepID=B9RG13_RICCO|nr:conserved hypothetical protein [Ricinus communis]
MVTGRLGEKQSFATASSSPKIAESGHNKYALMGEFAPVYMVMGFVSVAIGIGLHTAKQQLVHSPSVNISKKRRESLPEVDIPEVVSCNGDKFINKSFLRKVAHIQKDKRTLPDPTLPNPYTRSREAETLATVGVNPRRH